MSVGKGYSRPDHWPPVGSIVQVTETIRLGNSTAADIGDWVVVHLTQGTLIDARGERYKIALSLLFEAGTSPNVRPRFNVFRRGRRDYSSAWHATPTWMDSIR